MLLWYCKKNLNFHSSNLLLAATWLMAIESKITPYVGIVLVEKFEHKWKI